MNQCFICKKKFLFGEPAVRCNDLNTKKYNYYHITCVSCMKCQKQIEKDGKNFLYMIYSCGKFCFDQVLCDRCKQEKNSSVEQTNKSNFHISFQKINIHNYGQLLFGKFKQRYRFEDQPSDLIIDNDECQGTCVDEDVIDIRKSNDYKKPSLNSKLTCCQKDWISPNETNPNQCSRCHKSFTRFDIYKTDNNIDYYCNTCWIYQKEYIEKYPKQPSCIRCNLCGKVLLDQLSEDVIALNFVHPACLEKHLNDDL